MLVQGLCVKIIGTDGGSGPRGMVMLRRWGVVTLWLMWVHGSGLVFQGGRVFWVREQQKKGGFRFCGGLA